MYLLTILPRDSTPEFDDSVSMAGSAKSAAKIRTTAAQRIQSIQSHPSCGKIEPHRAFCTSCNKWANLGKQQTYSLRMWAKHRSRCDMQPEETSYVTYYNSVISVHPELED